MLKNKNKQIEKVEKNLIKKSLHNINSFGFNKEAKKCFIISLYYVSELITKEAYDELLKEIDANKELQYREEYWDNIVHKGL